MYCKFIIFSFTLKYIIMIMVIKMQENIEFKSIDELYNRVFPALYSKAKEIKNLGYKLVTERDVWNYLVNSSWKKRNDLELNDLVTDILYSDNYRIYEYVMDKMNEMKKTADKKEDNSVL